jgi:hypothetical protein
MIVEAVRKDRLPGGRNGSSIYNLYKLKYRKTRKNARNPASTSIVDRPQNLEQMQPGIADSHCQSSQSGYHTDAPVNKNLIQVSLHNIF